MTISATTVRVTYAGDGSSLAFPTTFAFFGSAELQVVLVTAGVPAFLVLGTDYTVAGGNGVTGAVTMTTAPASGTTLMIWRLTNRTQLIDFVANDTLSAAALERGFDRAMAALEEDADQFTRVLRAPSTEPATTNLQLPAAATRAGLALGFDSSGNLALFTPTGVSAVIADAVTFTPTATGSLARSVAAKLNDTITVKDFGAVGSGAVNDAGAFTAAAASVANGASVSIGVPAGTYRLDTTPVLGTRKVLWKFEAGATITGAGAPLPGTIIGGADSTAGLHISRTSSAEVNPAFQVDFTESATPGSSTYLDAFVFNHVRTGGNGHRQGVTSQITVNGAAQGSFNVGLCGFGFLQSGSGDIFGGNFYAQGLAGLTSTAELSGLEVNTDLRSNIVRKTGIQIYDASSSTGDGSAVSAGLILGRQVGGFGWQTGIQFGDDVTALMEPARSALLRTGNAYGVGVTPRGIDFRTAAFVNAAIDLKANYGAASQICWDDGSGGSIQSQTLTLGPKILFGSNSWAIANYGNTQQSLYVDTSGSPGVTVYLPGIGLRQLNGGAANSGGAGNRMVVVPN